MRTTYTLSNNNLTLSVDTLGAQIISLKDKNGKEYMWQRNPEFWDKSAPIMFPICGGLKDDTYYYNGKKYILEKHGFIQPMEFEKTEQTDSVLVLSVKDTAETFEKYPFNFVFSVKFELCGESLKVSYITENTGSNTMYFSPGAHEGYACPEGIEAYDVIFDKEESLERCIVDGNLLAKETEHVETDGKVLHMKYSHMNNDCLCFRSINSDKVTLVNRATGKGVRVEFEDFRYFVMWTKQQAPYLCIEPWTGLPDSVDSDMILEHKEGITALEPGKVHTCVHTITPVL